MIIATAARYSTAGRPKTLHAKHALEQSVVAGSSEHRTTEDPRTEFSEQEWHDMVATAAYYRAEGRGFDGGSTEQDWYEAEAELRERFTASDSNIESVSTSGGEATGIETKGE